MSTVATQTLNPYRWADHLASDVARYYWERYKQPFMVAIGKYEDFDIISVDGSICIEMKTESTTSRTGNVAIEYFSIDFDKPSGILSTCADLWLHVVLENGVYTGYECTVDKLRKLVIETGEVKSNGRNALIKLIPLDVFKQHAKKVFEIVINIPGDNRRPDIAGTIIAVKE